MFAAIYYVVDKSMESLSLFPQFRAMILAVVPNVAQSLIAGAGDFYTWQLAEKIYGTGSNIGWATVGF
jgi:phosphatidylinositol glycan class B